MRTPDPTQIIQALGGPTEVAKIFEITSQAVSQWKTNGIPRSHLRFLRATRPELFSGEETPNREQ